MNKSEYGPVRDSIERIIHLVQQEIRNSSGFSFRFELTGSGKRRLVTREVGGNKGFDLDYNLLVQPDVMHRYSAKELKDMFMNAFGKAVSGTGFRPQEDSTYVTTIKSVDKNRSLVEYGCDLAIMSDEDGKRYFIKHHKDNGGYGYEPKCNLDDLDGYIANIKNNCGNDWNDCILDRYLVLKNINRDPNKHPYSLYIETVKNLSNEIRQ